MAKTQIAPTNMTSNVLPTPFVAASSSHFDGTVDAYKAFDGTVADRWLTAQALPQWLSLDLGSGNATIVNNFSIQCSSNTVDPPRMPKDFLFQGSNDNSTWTTLRTVTGEVGWGINETRNYYLEQASVAYRYYRIYITANNGDAQVCVGKVLIYSGANAPSVALATLQDRYVSRKLGVFHHYGMSTYLNSFDSFGTGSEAVDTFAPTNVDVDGWLDTDVLLGAKYAVLTVKHVNGFCLWPTAVTNQNVSKTTWYANGGFDIVKKFVEGCRARNLTPAFYFSIGDKTAELANGGTPAAGTAAAWMTYVQKQLFELLTNYGPIAAIWFDAWGYWYPNGTYDATNAIATSNGLTYIPYATINAFIKGIQPDCLVLDNDHFPISGTYNPSQTEITLREDGVDGRPTSGNTVPVEGTFTLLGTGSGPLWFWNPNYVFQDKWRFQTMQKFADEWNNYGAALVNLPPNRAGSIDKAIVDVARQALYPLQTKSLAANQNITYNTFYAHAGAYCWPRLANTDDTANMFTNTVTANFYVSDIGDTTPFWQVDLGYEQYIAEVIAFNRTNIAVGRFRDIVVTVYAADGTTVRYTSAVLNPQNTNPTPYPSTSGGGVNDYTNGQTEVSCLPKVKGRYVKISRNTTGSTDDQCSLQIQRVLVASSQGVGNSSTYNTVSNLGGGRSGLAIGI